MCGTKKITRDDLSKLQEEIDFRVSQLNQLKEDLAQPGVEFVEIPKGDETEPKAQGEGDADAQWGRVPAYCKNYYCGALNYVTNPYNFWCWRCGR